MSSPYFRDVELRDPPHFDYATRTWTPKRRYNGKIGWTAAVAQYIFAEYALGDVFSISDFARKYLYHIIHDTNGRSKYPRNTLSRYITEDFTIKPGLNLQDDPKKNYRILERVKLGWYRLIAIKLEILMPPKGSKGEMLTVEVLEEIKRSSPELSLRYSREQCLTGLVSPVGASLRLDFAVRIVNTEGQYIRFVIEFDGRQHYEVVEHFGGVEGFKKRVRLDKIKDRYCKKRGLYMIRVQVLVFSELLRIITKEIQGLICVSEDVVIPGWLM